MEDEADVLPVLSVLNIDDPYGESAITVILKRDSGEYTGREESAFPLPKWPLIKAAGGAKVEEVPEEEEDTPPEGEEEPREEAEVERQPETEPVQPAKSKKARVQVDPNASIQETAVNIHCLPALPLVPESETPYVPILYTFRVKTRGKDTKLKNIKTKPPPFYLQFDHTIAVVWTLFNSEANKNNLGIVQLQWALHFLQSIYNDAGVHPQDVQLCIDTIQEYLINKYAEMSGESVMYSGLTPFGDYVNVDKKETPPFSVNYSQMIKKCPPCVLESKESEMLDKQLLDELENVKKVVGIESIDLTKVVSKDQVINILNDWKKEQIEKIQDELKMLYVVEDMMKNSDSQNFEGYTDESQFKTIFKKN